MNVYDYQGEINKYLKYGKKKDPLDLGADQASGPIDSLGEAVFGMDDWKKYRAGNSADREPAKERETPAPPPTEAPVAPVDTPTEQQPAALNTSLWEKASKSPDGFSMFGNDEPDRQVSVMDKAFFKHEAEDGVREHERTLSSTDDPFSSNRAEINKKYRLDDLYRDVTDHKKNFWHSTPKDQVVFNQKLQKYQAALQAAEREDALYLSARRQTPRADDMFQTTTIRDPETGKDMVTKVYRSGRTEVIGQSPTDELAGRRSTSASPVPKSSIFSDPKSGASGYVDGGRFMPIENPLDPAGPAQDGTTANNFLTQPPAPPPARATPRPAAEPKPTVDPLDKQIAEAEETLRKANIALTNAPRARKEAAKEKVANARDNLADLRARKGGGQAGAAPAGGAAPLATVTTPSGAKVSVRKKSE